MYQTICITWYLYQIYYTRCCNYIEHIFTLLKFLLQLLKILQKFCRLGNCCMEGKGKCSVEVINQYYQNPLNASCRYTSLWPCSDNSIAFFCNTWQKTIKSELPTERRWSIPFLIQTSSRCKKLTRQASDNKLLAHLPDFLYSLQSHVDF